MIDILIKSALKWFFDLRKEQQKLLSKVATMSSVHEEDDRDFDGDINVDDVDSDSRISCESDIDLDGSCYDDNEMHLRWVFFCCRRLLGCQFFIIRTGVDSLQFYYIERDKQMV